MGQLSEVKHKLWMGLSLGFFFWFGALFDFYIAETCSTKQVPAFNSIKPKSQARAFDLMTLMLRT